MLAASPALFPSTTSAKPQQNNPAPVTEREGGREGGNRGGVKDRGSGFKKYKIKNQRSSFAE